MLRIKRVYEERSLDDGARILIDRVWPRGISKERANLDRWAKELAPSTELRKWFNHEPDKWPEFVRRYRQELEGRRDELRELRSRAEEGNVTLVYSASDLEHNQAVALRQIIEELGR